MRGRNGASGLASPLRPVGGLGGPSLFCEWVFFCGPLFLPVVRCTSYCCSILPPQRERRTLDTRNSRHLFRSILFSFFPLCSSLFLFCLSFFLIRPTTEHRSFACLACLITGGGQGHNAPSPPRAPGSSSARPPSFRLSVHFYSSSVDFHGRFLDSL